MRCSGRKDLELAAPLSLASVRPVHCDWSQSTWPCAHFSISGKAPPCRCQRNTFFRGGGLARRQCSLLKKEKRLREEFQHAKALSKRGELRFRRVLPPPFVSTRTRTPVIRPLGRVPNWAGSVHCEPRWPALRTSLLAPKWGSLIPFQAAGQPPVSGSLEEVGAGRGHIFSLAPALQLSHECRPIVHECGQDTCRIFTRNVRIPCSL